MVNETGMPFVLPTGGMYMFKNIINCPITPTRAITLVRNDAPVLKELIDGDVCKVFKVENLEQVLVMNKRAIHEEIERDRQYVAAPTREVLEKTLQLFRQD